MLHLIRPGSIGGPNVSMKNISESALSDKYSFSFLVQKRKAKKPFDFKLIKNMAKQIDKEKPSIVHISGLQIAGFYAVKAALKSKTKPKIICTIHGSSTESTSASKLKKWIIKHFFEKYILRKADACFTVCERPLSLEMIKKYSKNYVGCIYNIPPTIDNSVTTFDYRKKLDYSEEDLVFVYAGRLVKEKGMDYLDEALYELNELKNAKTWLIGDGPYRTVLEHHHEELIKNNQLVIFGQLENPVKIIKEADIAFLPSHHENLPNFLLEGLALGKPIIATNVGGNSTIVINKYNGLLISRSSKSLLEAFRYFEENKCVKDYSNNSKTVLNTKFSKEKILEALDDLYSTFL